MSRVGKVMKKESLDNILGPKCGKSGLFRKLGLALGLGLGLGLPILLCDKFFFFFCQYIFYKDGQIADRS